MLSKDFWRGKRVLVTGHTGFKGSWLCILLRMLGAQVHGASKDVPTQPSLFELAKVSELAQTEYRDIRDLSAMREIVRGVAPDIVVHAAAQSLVRESYTKPIETFETNIVGTANVLEAVRGVASVRVVVAVTTDKCYENAENRTRFKEDDRLGGKDPYSASKAAAEIVIEAMRSSFFPPDAYASHRVALASVRAGNVIGGGDWARDRLVPDIMQALLAGRAPRIRNPDMVRPWQHVLDPLHGYLMLCEKLWSSSSSHSEAWNFGPDDGGDWSVRQIADRICALWGTGARWEDVHSPDAPRESFYLALDSQKARQRLGWRPVLDLEGALQATAGWYKAYGAGDNVRAFTEAQIRAFLRL